ncbi:hypothetical protein ACYSNU_18790 [Enterococcus sp. LJL120]
MFRLMQGGNNSAEISEIGLFKLSSETDSVPPYTPKPSEYFEDAYPLYQGTYSNNNPEASTEPSKYTWSRILGQTGQDGTDGLNGKDGTNGKDGVGIVPGSTVIDYQVSSSGTTPPTGTWTTAIPQMKAGQYLWTRTTFTFTDGTKKSNYTVGMAGKDGTSGIIVSQTAPQSPEVNQLWQDTSASPIMIKRWTGSAWVEWGMSIDNLIVENVAIENGVFKTLSGVEINASRFVNTFTKVPLPNNSGSTATGTTTLVNGELNSTGLIDNTFPIQTIYNPVGLDQVALNPDGSVRFRQQLTQGLLILQDSVGNQGSLSSEEIMDTGWVYQTVLTGTGSVAVRRRFGRWLILLDGWRPAASGREQKIFTFPAAMNPKRQQMVLAGAWNLQSTSEKFQLNADGAFYRITETQGQVDYRTIIEVFS